MQEEEQTTGLCFGAKFAEFEGGYRVNAFVSGGYLPDIQRGNVTEEYIHVSDW